MVEGLQEFRPVRVVAPVPWTEHRPHRAGLHLPYPAAFPTFWFVPRVAPMALARSLLWSTQSTRDRIVHDFGGGPVLAYWTDPDGTVAVEWADEIGQPSVVIVGGSDLLLLARSPRRKARMARTLGRANHVLAIGSQLAERVTDLGIPAERVSVLRRGVDRKRFAPGDRHTARAALGLPTDRPILLWVGRMVPVKGLEVLLEALGHPTLRSMRPLLVLVGDGPLRADIARRGARLLARDDLRMIGTVSHDMLPVWYRSADLTVLTSHSEGVPNVLLESLASGTGFVATDVGSVREITSNPERDLVPPGHAATLALRISERLNAPSEVTEQVPDTAESTASILRVFDQI